MPLTREVIQELRAYLISGHFPLVSHLKRKWPGESAAGEDYNEAMGSQENPLQYRTDDLGFSQERLSVYRALSVQTHLVDTFGSAETASVWLTEICPALGVRPIDLMDDEKGRQTVNDLLVCIDHGTIY